MKKISIIVLVVAIAALAGVVVWQNLAQSKPSSSLPKPSSALPPQANQEQQPQVETAGWKTYRNEQYGFELKYPSEWYEKHFSVEPSIVTLQNVDCFFCIYAGGPCGECYPDAGVKIIISAENRQRDISLSELLNQCDDKITFDCKNISIAGIDAVRVTRLVDIGAGLPDIYVPNGNKIFRINYGDNSSKKDLRESYLSIFDQILSTFKFLK